MKTERNNTSRSLKASLVIPSVFMGTRAPWVLMQRAHRTLGDNIPVKRRGKEKERDLREMKRGSCVTLAPVLGNQRGHYMGHFIPVCVPAVVQEPAVQCGLSVCQ